MKKYLFFLLVILLAFKAYSQPTLTWQKNYGGSNSEQPFGSETTHSGGIICGGHSLSNDGLITSNNGDYDWWIIKLDALGNLVWSKSYGGSLYDKCRYATENSDFTILAFGSVKSNDGDVSGNKGNNDYWLLKLDTAGNIIWKKCYGGTLEEGGRSVIQTSDGHYLMAGYSRSNDGDVSGNHGSYDVWLVKVNANDGSIIWQKCFGGSKEERVRSIIEMDNGDFVFTGNAQCTDGDLAGTSTKGDEDVWTARISSNGTLLWSVQYGSSLQDRAYHCTVDRDGHILVAGKNSANDGDVTNNHGLTDCWILKLNSNNGALIWQKSFGGSKGDEGFRIDPNPDGGYTIGATSESNDLDVSANKGYSDYWLFKIDSSLNVVWQKNFGGGSWDHLNDIVKMKDGGYAGIGFSSSKPNAIAGKSDITFNYGSFDMWIVKINYCDTQPNIIVKGSLALDSNQTVTLTTTNYESASFLWSNGATTDTIVVSNPGSYYATISHNTLGCVTQTDTVIVTQNNICVPPNNINVNSISASSAIITWDTITGAKGYNLFYRKVGTTVWTKLSFGPTISSAHLQNLLAATKYQFKLRTKCKKNPNVFSPWSVLKAFTTNPLRSLQSRSNSNCLIFPNPARDKITIENSALGDAATISISDVSGRICLKTVLDYSQKHSQVIDISMLENGYYFVFVDSKTIQFISTFSKTSN